MTGAAKPVAHTLGANPSATVPLFRGKVAQTAMMEQLQNAYVQAIAAASGCFAGKPNPDTQGIDWTLIHESDEHTGDQYGVQPTTARPKFRDLG